MKLDMGVKMMAKFGTTNNKMIQPGLSGFIILVLLLIVCGCRGNSGNEGSLNQMVEKARSMQDQAKLKMIESAVAQYSAEYGQSPESLHDLVAEGYLGPDSIKDHQGRQFSYTPELYSDDMGITTMSKSCGACGKGVSSSSKVGDRCPHCGVVWGYEQTSYTN